MTQNPQKQLISQKLAYFWWACAFCCFALVGISHLFFQNYLFMRPCEQCVYIRYAFVTLGLGGVILGFGFQVQKKQNLASGVFFIVKALAKILGFLVAFYGSIRGIIYSAFLLKVHRALNSSVFSDSSEFVESSEEIEEVIFGLQGCSMKPRFDFGLPLDEWLPSVFAPTGDCGQDFALPPSDMVLAPLREYFIEAYSQGWYLLPSVKFGTMAECCLLAFGIGLVLISVGFVCYVRSVVPFLCARFCSLAQKYAKIR